MNLPESADMDFVAGAFVLKDEKVLLLNHSKYGIWLQPGGHVEEDETPDETAVRETLEETGMKVEVLDKFETDTSFDDAEDLPTPFNVNLHQVEDGHYHCDFQYLVELKGRIDTYEYSDEDIRWFSAEEIRNLDNIPENAKSTALRALDSLK